MDPLTLGDFERSVWAAAYGAAFTQSAWEQGRAVAAKRGLDGYLVVQVEDFDEVARIAAGIADEAVRAMRRSYDKRHGLMPRGG